MLYSVSKAFGKVNLGKKMQKLTQRLVVKALYYNCNLQESSVRYYPLVEHI